MPLSYPHLDSRIRAFMLRELRRDRRRKRLVPSPRLSPEGKKRFPKLLGAAIEDGDDASLASGLRGFLNPLEVKRSPFCVADVPRTAATVIAEGAFNRFYVRALCLRAIEDGIESLQVFRAKAVESPRPEGERLIGKAWSLWLSWRIFGNTRSVRTCWECRVGGGLGSA